MMPWKDGTMRKKDGYPMSYAGEVTGGVRKEVSEFDILLCIEGWENLDEVTASR